MHYEVFQQKLNIKEGDSHKVRALLIGHLSLIIVHFLLFYITQNLAVW